MSEYAQGWADTPSLVAILMEITPLAQGTIPLYVGYGNLAATLAYLAQFDATLITATHDEDAPKPLTCSTLMGKITRQQGLALVRPGERYWLRFTGLTAAVCDLLLAAFGQAPPTEWTLAGQRFAVLQTLCDPHLHPWSGATSYEVLWHAPRRAPERKITLELASPTAFRSDALTLTLPQPDLVFGSLLDRWNTLSPLPLEVTLRPWCRAAVEASRFELGSVLFEPKKGLMLVGATGTITYAVRDSNAEGVRLLNLLADFAFYSGVGMKASMGMGQVRRI